MIQTRENFSEWLMDGLTIISLSKSRTDEKLPSTASATQMAPSSQNDYTDDDDGCIDLRPAKGFAAYIPNPPSSNKSQVEEKRKQTKDRQQ